MKLSNQAVGALLMTLQKCLAEQTDITELLSSWDLEVQDNEEVTCFLCKSQNIKKNLSGVLQVTKKCYNNKEKTGDQVNRAIEEGKQELETYKKKQEKRIYTKK